jgi:penicillin-binding protein 1A
MDQEESVIKEKFNLLRETFKRWTIYKKIAVILSCIFIISIISIISLRLLAGFGAFGPIPEAEDLRNIKNPLASEIYADAGELIGRYYVENRSQLTIDDLNDNYKNALIATEDARFYTHNGVDYRSLFRVFFKSVLLQNNRSGGGSTITQQLAKNLFPRKRYTLFSTLINKFREMSIAHRIEDVYTKDEILLMYSNTVSFGERAFGLSVAAKRFFNKNPYDLNLSEAATLVGMLKATSYYSPRNYPDRAQKRRNVVLSQMVKYNFLIPTDTVGLLSNAVELDYTPLSQEEEFAKYYKQHLTKEIRQWQDTSSVEDIKSLKLSYDGIKIYTTVDYDLQVAAETIMKKHMTALQKIFIDSWKGGNMYGKNNKLIDEKLLADPYYKNLRNQGWTNKEVIEQFSNIAERQIWTWQDGLTKKEITKIDSIKNYLSLLHTGLLAVQPQSGEVKAWVGGNDYGSFQYDNVTSPRQVGSLFKPIVYLTALQRGKSPCDFYKNELRNYTSYQDWTPHNADEEYGGYMSMRGALTQSVNTVSVQVLFDAGIEKVVDMAQRMGIASELSAVPSIVLGTSDVSLYDIVSAYSTMANRGIHMPIRTIKRVEDKNGVVLYEQAPVDSSALKMIADTIHVDEINAMLENVVRYGTGSRLYANYRIPSVIRGKTGTTQNQSDGWFIGYTDDLVIGAWVGTEDRRMHFRNLGTGSGGRTALPMVGGLFEYAYAKNKLPRQLPSELEFDCPDSLDDLAYANYQKREEILTTRRNFGGWLRDIFSGKDPKRKTKKEDNYQQRSTKERLEEIEKDKLKWNKRLRRRRRK